MEKNNRDITPGNQQESFVKYIGNICGNMPKSTAKKIAGIFHTLGTISSSEIYFSTFNSLVIEYKYIIYFLEFRQSLGIDPINNPIKLSHSVQLYYQNQVILIKDSLFYAGCLLLADRIKSYDILYSEKILYDLKSIFMIDRKYFELLSDIEIRMEDFKLSHHTGYVQEIVSKILLNIGQK